jgi:DNA-binding transcriptional MerR regulator
MNIKEIEERSGLTRANIRYYEQEGLLAPARRENKYRDYSEEDLETLLRIALLRNLGFSLDEIRRLQSGELELAAAMRERSAALESEGQRLLAARNVCDAISREVTSYSALRPEDYLNGFEPDAAAGRCRAAPVAALPCPCHRPHAHGNIGLVCAVHAAAP